MSGISKTRAESSLSRRRLPFIGAELFESRASFESRRRMYRGDHSRFHAESSFLFAALEPERR